jgi:hypothetical protein
VSENGRAIRVTYPQTDDLQLKVCVGECRLDIAPGSPSAWVSGRYEDPTGELPCRVTRRGGLACVSQPQQVNLFELLNGVPRFALRLGGAKPYAVTVEEAAGESALDFGGLPIRDLRLEGRAGAIALDFSAPNPQLMRTLEIDTGQATLSARNLANANFGELCFGGRGAHYVLDFGGALRHSAQVDIAVGTRSTVEIIVPATTAARVSTTLAGGILDVGDGWRRLGDAFCTPAGVSGSGPVLAVDAGATVGALRLRIANP